MKAPLFFALSAALATAALLSSCSLSGSGSGDPIYAPRGVDFNQRTRTDCVDLSGRYRRTVADGRVTERTLTQAKCDELRIQDEARLDIDGQAVVTHSDQTYLADGVCRETTAGADQCSTQWFTRRAFVVEITRRPAPQPSFRAGLFETALGADGNLIETFLFLGPAGETLDRQTLAWSRVK
jgi:hypothetical protein